MRPASPLPHCARLDDSWPADKHRDAMSALPVVGLRAAKPCLPTIRPGPGFGPIVGGVDNDGVVGDGRFIEFPPRGFHCADAIVQFSPTRYYAEAYRAANVGMSRNLESFGDMQAIEDESTFGGFVDSDAVAFPSEPEKEPKDC